MIEEDKVLSYVKSFEQSIQERLNLIRTLTKTILIKADESLKYGVITYSYHHHVFHVGAYKNHIGIYPSPQIIESYQKELVSYKKSKGAFQIQHDQEIPFDLLETMLKDIKENHLNL